MQGLDASFVLEGRKLAISRANVQLAGLAASFKGTLTESGVDVTFSAAASGSRTLPLPPGAAFASLAAEGAVRGPWKAPQVNLTAQVRKLSFQGVTLESANLNGALAGWPPQSGSLKVVGSGLRTPGGKVSRLTLNAGGAGGRWQFQVAAASPKEPGFEAAGTADLAARPLVLNVARLSWRSQALTVKNKTPFVVRLLPGWEISPATFQVNGGTLTVAGLARGQELSGELSLRDLDAGLFAPLGLPASGKLNGKLTLAGTPRTPIIDGQIALSAGKIKNIAIQTLTTTLNYRSEQAQVDGSLEIGPLHSRLIWKGSVPVKISLLPFAFALGQDGLDLKLHSEQVNLSLLTTLSQEVQSAEGPLDLVAEARGNPHHPKVSGYVRWRAGSLKLLHAGTLYRLAPGEIRLQGEKIVIPGSGYPKRRHYPALRRNPPGRPPPRPRPGSRRKISCSSIGGATRSGPTASSTSRVPSMPWWPAAAWWSPRPNFAPPSSAPAWSRTSSSCPSNPSPRTRRLRSRPSTGTCASTSPSRIRAMPGSSTAWAKWK